MAQRPSVSMWCQQWTDGCDRRKRTMAFSLMSCRAKRTNQLRTNTYASGGVLPTRRMAQSGRTSSHCWWPTQTMGATSNDRFGKFWQIVRGGRLAEGDTNDEMAVRFVNDGRSMSILVMWAGAIGSLHHPATMPSIVMASVNFHLPIISIPPIMPSSRRWSIQSTVIWRRRRAVCPHNWIPFRCSIWTIRIRWCWKTIRIWRWLAADVDRISVTHGRPIPQTQPPFSTTPSPTSSISQHLRSYSQRRTVQHQFIKSSSIPSTTSFASYKPQPWNHQSVLSPIV